MIYSEIKEAYHKGQKLLAVLLDPDKLVVRDLSFLMIKISRTKITHILVGGSQVLEGKTKEVVEELKKHTTLPVVLFPGNYTQLTNLADGLLYLSLLSGRNPEYLIGQHIKAASFIKQSNLEVISTGYILIDGDVTTAVQKVSDTIPLSQDDTESIVSTALAGQYLGNKLVYLEAGSGAKRSVSGTIIKKVSKALNIPVIVGGGIRTINGIEAAYEAGATMVVIGTIIEENETFLENLKMD